MDKMLTEQQEEFKNNMDLVLNVFQHQIDCINDELKEFDSPSSFLKTVIQNIQPNDLFKLGNIKIVDYILASYLSQLSYDEAKEKSSCLYEIKYAIHNMDPTVFASCLKNPKKLSHILEKEIQDNRMFNFEDGTIDDDDPILSVIYSDEFLQSCQKIIVLANLKTTINSEMQISKTKKLGKKDFQRLQNNFYKEAKKQGIIDDFEGIIAKFYEWEKQEKVEKHTLQKQRTVLSKLQSQIYYQTFNGISEKEEQIIGEEATLVLYAYLATLKQYKINFLSHQLDEFSYLEDTYKNEQLLAQYHIDTNQMTEAEKKEILKVNNSTFQRWMEELTKLNIAPSSISAKTLSQILQYGNLDTVPELQSIIARNFASPTFIKEHPGVFVTQTNKELEPLYEIMLHNRDVILRTNINVADDAYCADILLTNPSDMDSRFSLAQLYQVDLTNTSNMMNYLSGKISFDTIDTMIESNLSSNDLKIGKLKMSQQEFLQFQKRVAIAKQIGLFGCTSQGVSTNMLLTGNKFKISTSELDEFTANATIYFLNPDMTSSLKKSKRDHYTEVESIKKLSNYENGLTYQIGSITLSAPKVKRNLQALKDDGYEGDDALFQSCIYGSILTLPQIEEIHNAVYPAKIKEKK